MTNWEAIATTKDFYLKAPCLIDYHLTSERSVNEVKQSKYIIKKIINYCVNKNNGKKIVIDLKNTRHIGRACIKILARFIRDDPNFIMYRPNQALYKRLIDNGFPKINIQSGEESLVTT